MKAFEFALSCIDSDAESLYAMDEASAQVTYRTMLRNCRDLLEWAYNHGYCLRSNHGLTLRGDWHVAYYRSTYRGQPCYYLVWSAYHMIWL